MSITRKFRSTVHVLVQLDLQLYYSIKKCWYMFMYMYFEVYLQLCTHVQLNLNLAVSSVGVSSDIY
eukprot:SAG31_NODE_1255_length_9082_cov_35.353668_7_plen_66_part_00